MSDLEYDSGDSSEEVSAEDSSLQTAETAAAGGEEGSAVGRESEPPASGMADEEQEESEEEEEEGSEGEEGGGGESPEGEGEEPTDEEVEEEGGRSADVVAEPEKTAKNVKSSAFLDSSDESANEGEEGEGEREREVAGGLKQPAEVEEEGEEEGEGEGEGEQGEGERAVEATKVVGGGRKFLEDSDDEEGGEANTTGEQVTDSTEQDISRTESTSQEDVFGASDDEGEKGEEGRGKKRKRGSVSGKEEGESETEQGEDEEVKTKKLKEGTSDDESLDKGEESDEEEKGEGEGKREGEGEGEGEEEEGSVPEVGGEKVVGGEERGEEEEEDDNEEPGPSNAGVSDWDLMMQKRKEAMARARKRRKRDIDITAVDDHIMAMIREMRQAVDEDRQLNQARQPALKKLKMLPTVIVNLKKSDLQTSFIECGILTVLAEWLNPLPDRSLPHLKIRESILDILKTYPVQESHILKSSRIGKAVMLLYRHPNETRKNKEKAGKIINEWARPIFGLASDFKSLGRDEREERDYANLSQANKRKLSSSNDPSKKNSQEEEYEPVKPGDKGWVGRARVPMPSTKDYVVRPKWKAEQEFKTGPSKKVMNRYEKQMNKEKQRKMRGKTSHAVSISVEGRKMPH